MIKKIIIILFIKTLFLSGVAFARSPLLINGAGATFPYPLYSKWFSEYKKIDPTVNFNYQSIGSGGGIRQLIYKTVDFGASDAPMSDKQLRKLSDEILHIPTVAGAVVIAYNLPDVKQNIKLTSDIIVDIFLGKIKKWNNPRIISTNPDINLPSNKNIIVIHRSDGSGTTNIFTDYLSGISKEWKERVGKGIAVRWPTGLGGKGNEGVGGLIKQLPFSIGYVELAYAIKNNLSYAFIKNKAGKFVKPTIKSITDAIAGAVKTIPPDFRASIVNPEGKNTYPIVGLTWILVYKNQDNEIIGKKIVEFLWWAIHDGQKYASSLLYAPLPSEMVRKIERKIKEINYKGKPLL
jgi:phosphate transport system substrate-binding protein